MKLNSNRPEIGKRKFILNRVYNPHLEVSTGGELRLKIWDIYMNNISICSYVSAKTTQAQRQTHPLTAWGQK